jgi:iron complex outermembrane recepter protein
VKPYFFILFLLPFYTSAQQCNYTLSGRVLDISTQEPLDYSSVQIEGTTIGAKTNNDGYFEIKNICTGDIHLLITHIGCEAKRLFIQLRKDTSITIYLPHHHSFLHQIVVKGKSIYAEEGHVISEKELNQQSGNSLANIASSVSGVSVLKTGAGITKPIIHGLYGARIQLINNDITQQSQSWGNDHAPEIDPFASDNIAVIKGVYGIEFGGNTIGGALKMNSEPISDDPHVHGKALYSFATNNQLNVLATRFEKKAKYFKWRVGGAVQQGGDYRTANYFLSNTAFKQASVFVQLEKDWSTKLKSDFHYSYFANSLGILRGAHAGNLTDLENAMGANEPAFTDTKRGFDIEAPRQNVQHHLFKTHFSYQLNKDASLQFIYGWQLNNRKEFDIRRGGRTDVPSLGLTLAAHDAKLFYHKLNKEKSTKVGVQYQYQNNTNDALTGILPLQADYQLYDIGFFYIRTLQLTKKTELSVGARQDIRNMDARLIRNFNVEKVLVTNYNTTISVGLDYNWTKKTATAFNLSTARRGPEVNELFSNGLHQGVASIEEGNINLKNEWGTKAILTQHLKPSKKLQAEGSLYYQYIHNYIYLQPQDSFRLTIRGAFPLFIYEQTDATIAGFDATVNYHITERLSLLSKWALIHGQDVRNNIPLIYMPSNNLYMAFQYELKDIEGAKMKLSGTTFSINGDYVARQNRLLASQDFMPAPDAYFLLGARAETNVIVGEQAFYISLQAQNVLNTSYRNYLNRLRYFSDDLGRNITMRILWKF